jgi:hypothetical protein
MTKSAKGMEETYKRSGKRVAMKYCSDWKAELDTEGKNLAEQLKSGAIDQRLFNQKRLSLNQQTVELNSSILALNKLP